MESLSDCSSKLETRSGSWQHFTTFLILSCHILLYHSLHAVLHVDKLARRYFSMGGTEQLGQCQEAKECLCVSVYVGQICETECV